MRAAFVALTVAGQQGHSPLSMPAPPFWIFDCQFWIGIESKIQNQKLEVGAGRGESPLSLNPSAADYRSFIASSIQISIGLLLQKRHLALGWLARDNEKKPRLMPTSRRLFGLSGKD